VNAHGGFLVGLFFLTLAFLLELAQHWLGMRTAMDRKTLAWFGVSSGLCYIAILLNPHGLQYHFEIIGNMFSKEYIGDATQLFAYYNMWDYLFTVRAMYRFSNGAWAMVLMAGISAVLWTYAFVRNRFFDLSVTVLTALFFLMGMSTARVTIFFPLVWLPSIVYLVRNANLREEAKGWASSISPIVLVFVGGILIYSMLFYSAHQLWFGYRTEEFYPVKEIEFIRRNGLPPPIFNDYAMGGYLLWALYPDYKVFIDPRYGPYVRQVWPDWVHLRDMLHTQGLKDFTAKYPFKVAFLSLREPYLIGWFLQSTEWRLLYFEKSAAILAHTSILSDLPRSALTADLSIERFKSVRNPLILMRLFNFCVNYRIKDAQEILRLYRETVPDWYAFKQEDIDEAQAALEFKESEGKQD
jgi:hypothetical protein